MTSRLAAPDRAATICRLFYSGSLVVRGSGLADVVATGPRSEIGKIGQSLQPLEAEPPRLQAQTARLVRLAALGGGAVSIVAVVLYGTLRGGWLDAVLAGITIGMSMLPEEFPVVLTFSWRWGPGEFPRHAYSPGAPLLLKRSAQRRSCVRTRPAR
jgi:Ca2+-transporting ATPase